MSFTTINSAGSLFEGSDSAEKIAVESGSLTRTTINASGGEDTVQVLLSGGPGGTAAYVDLNAGADFAELSGGTISETTILGGAGGDTINMSSMATFEDGQIKAGDGSDLLALQGDVFSGTDIIMGAGADTLIFTGTDGEVGNLTGASILGGSGNDQILLDGDVSMSATTIFGGGGNDVITVSGSLLDGGLINGDSTVNGGGADTIVFTGVGGGVAVGDSATIKGKGGADVITISGTVGDSAAIEGNAGADNITIGDALANTSTFIGGGSGNDTMTFSGTTVNQQNSTIQGGGGVDFISFNGDGVTYLGTGLRIYGGAGADTIQLGAAFSGETRGAEATGIIAFTDLSDSDLAGIDKITGGSPETISGFEFAIDTAAGITSFTVGAYSDSDENTPSVTAGVASGATFASADSGVTARVEELDGILTTKGTLVAFEAQGEDYIFIQGGSSGTSDDGVIEVQSGIGTFNVATDYQFGAELADN